MAKEAKFTQGPWKVHNRKSIHSVVSSRVMGNPSSAVAFAIEGRESDSEELLANARLIAAAPDLYDTVVDLVELAKYGREHLRETAGASVGDALEMAIEDAEKTLAAVIRDQTDA